MKTTNMKELKMAIERNEALYLRVEDYTLKQQIWQTLVYLRSILKSKRNSRM